MELFVANWILGFLMVTCLSWNEVEGQMVESYIVSAFEKQTGGFWCMGGVVSRNKVITSCRCIGSFAPPRFEDFVEIHPKLFILKTSRGITHPIVKIIKHSLCSVSYLNYTVNDLGGWKIRGSFDNTVQDLVPFFNRGITFKEAEARVKQCYLLSYSKLGAKVTDFQAIVNNFECFYYFCQTHLSKKGHGCDSFITSLLGADLQCGYNNVQWGVVRGSPIFCNLLDEEPYVYYSLGLVGTSDDKYSFWTRFDLIANRDFYSVLVTGKANRLFSFNVLLLSGFVIHATPLFQ